MSAPMPRQKRDALFFQRAHHDGVRRLPEGGLDANFACVLQTWHRVKPAAADDANRSGRCLPAFLPPRCCHSSPSKSLETDHAGPPRPLRAKMSLTAENGSFFLSATSSANCVSRASPPAPPSARCNSRDSSNSISRCFQCSTCLRLRSPLASKCLRKRAIVSASSLIPLLSEATVRTTGGCQPSR